MAIRFKKTVLRHSLACAGRCAALAILAGMALAGQKAQAAVTYQMVPVGNAGNAASIYTYGAVAVDYRIGKYEVTIQQYTDFLNAVAKTDDYSLYHPKMGMDLNSAGITQSGTNGSYTYSVMDNFGSSANRPITYVSWFDAARFANWMANGQPSGLTTQAEVGDAINDGAYPLGSATSGAAPTRNTINPNTGLPPAYYIPSEDEWFKAAFYSPNFGGPGVPGYYQYATQTSDAVPGNVIGSAANQVNYIVLPSGNYSFTQDNILSPTQNYLTDVGSFTGSASHYGTFDQNGNVWEVTDTAYGSNRALLVVRGGGWTSYSNYLWDSYRLSTSSSGETSNGGFRLAAPAP